MFTVVLLLAALARSCSAANASVANITWSFQDGTTNYDRMFAAAADPERNTVFLTGQTWGDYGTFQKEVDDIMDYYGDFLAIKLDLSTGEKLWGYQEQSGKPDLFNSASLDPETGDLIATGNTDGSYNCTGGCDWQKGSVITKTDFVAARISSETGNAVWTWQDGTSGADVAGSGSVDPATGDTVIVGRSQGAYAREREGSADRDVRAYPYEFDFTIVRLNKQGELVFKWQDGTDRSDELLAVAHGADGAVYAAGTTYGNYSAGSANLGGADIVVIKLDAAGEVLWSYQSAMAGDDIVTGIAVDAAGDAIVSGYVVDDGSTDQVESYEDFFVMKIASATGKVLWSWTDGTTSADVLSAVTVGDDGTVVAAGFTAGDYAHKGAGLSDAAVVGLDPATGALLWSWQDGSVSSDRANGIASAGPGKYVITGDTWGSLYGANKGGWDVFAALITVTNSTVGPA